MSKNHSTLIQRYSEKVLPEPYLRAVIKARPTAGGYAIQTKEDGKPKLVIDSNDAGADLEALQQFLAPPEYKEGNCLLILNQFDKFGEGDLQPFPFQIDGEDDLAVCIEGDFPTMIEGDLHPETKLWNTVIKPNLEKLRRLCTGDPEKFMQELQDVTFKEMLLSRMGNRGYVCFLPPIGDPVWITKDKFGSNFPWGKVSNTHGYVETPVAAPVAATKKGWWAGKAKAGPTLPVAEEKPEPAPVKADPPATPVPQADPPAAPGPDTRVNPPEVSPNPLEGTVVEVGNGAKGTWKRVPPMSKNDRKAFIRRATGKKDLPENWADPTFLFLDIEYPLPARSLPELKEKLEQQQAAKPVADAGTKLASAPSRGGEIVHEANTMMLTAEEKSAAENDLIKMLDRQGKDIPNPLDIQKMEAKYPKFTGQFGIKLDQVDKWLPSDLAEFAKENGKAFFHMFLELRRAKIEAEEALNVVAEKHGGKETTNHLLAKEELRPEPKKAASGGGWGKWKK